MLHARSLDPLEKTRAFGMTPSKGSLSLNRDGGPSADLDSVIPSEAVFQAERGISRGADMLHARSLDPLEKRGPSG